MTKTQKAEIIDNLTGEFNTANAVIMCDYRGLSHLSLEGLRTLGRSNDVKVQVVKNTLATVALKNAEMTGIEIIDTNIFIWGEDAISTAKTVAEFGKTNSTFAIRNAYIDGNVSDAATVEAFAKLPGRNELLGMLAATWMAPVQNFTIGINALKEKLEAEAS